MKIKCLGLWLTFEADTQENLHILLQPMPSWCHQPRVWPAGCETDTEAVLTFCCSYVKVWSNTLILILCCFLWTSWCTALSSGTADGRGLQEDRHSEELSMGLSYFLFHMANNVSLLMTSHGMSNEDLYADTQPADLHRDTSSPTLGQLW